MKACSVWKQSAGFISAGKCSALPTICSRVSLYELRHSFVSAIKTLPAGEVKALVGHSQDMDTFGQYSHALTGEDVQTAQAVNAVFMKLLHG